MDAGGLFDSLPLWLLLPLTILFVLLWVEVGYRVARYRSQRVEREKEAPVSGMVGATLGLLAFMLAFTFGLAASRFEDRRQAMLAEANAVGTAYLRAEMVPQPIASEARAVLREYVDVRLAAARSGNLRDAISKSEELHERLWSSAVAAAGKDRSPITGLFIQSVNEVIDLHATRVMAAVRSRIPGAIWLTLYLLAALAMGAIGYQHGLACTVRSLAVIGLVVAFSLVLILIVDLDRPGRGLLRVDQQAMVDVRNSMNGSGP
jgi:hypothetical protein